MIKLQRVELKNFLSHSESALDLDRRGLVLITGRNVDAGGANGAGKSALIASIPWALFGQTPQGLKADEVVKDGQTSCSVKLFGYKDNGFCIERTRGPAGLRWWIAGNEMTGPSIKETQAALESYLGLDYKSFISSVLFPQGFAGFGSMSQAEQKEILNSLLDLGRFEEAFERLKAYRTVVNADLVALVESKRSLEQSIRAEQEHIQSMEAAARVFEDQKSSRINSLQKQIDSLGTPTKLSKDDMTQLRALELEDPVYLSQRLSSEQAILERKQTNDLLQLATARQHYQTLLNALREPQEPTELNCELCGQAMPPEAKGEALKAYNLALAKYQADKVEYQDQINKLQAEELAIKVTRVNQDGAFTQRSKALEHKARQLNNLRKIEAVRKDYDAKKSLLVEAITSEMERTWSGQASIEQAKAKILQYQAELPKIEKQHQEMSEELAYIDFWHEGFGTTGLRHFALASITPYLSDRANYYLGQLTGGAGSLSITTQRETKKGSLSDSLHIEADLGGGKVYHARSGGEQRRISIALLFALAELMATKARVQVNLMFLDEPMESVDADGASAIISLLQTELSKHKESIFLVSHNEALKSEIENVIIVEKRDGTSSITS